MNFRPSVGSVDAVEIQSRLGRLYLLERHTVFHHILHPALNHGHHIAVIHDIGSIRQVPVPRYHVRAAFLAVLRDEYFDQVIDGIQKSADGPPFDVSITG